MAEGEEGESPPKKGQPSTADSPAKKQARELDFAAIIDVVSSSDEESLDHLNSSPTAPPRPLPALPVNPQSSKSRPRYTIYVNGGTYQKQQQCQCKGKNTKCLNMNCGCFASGVVCCGCNCINCYNNMDNESVRGKAIMATLKHNRNAFRPRIAGSPYVDDMLDSAASFGEVSSSSKDSLDHPNSSLAAPPPLLAAPVNPDVNKGAYQKQKQRICKDSKNLKLNSDVNEGTYQKQKPCKCKDKCLTLNCRCFASGVFCCGCNCANCNNNMDNEYVRGKAIVAALKRNPNTFRPKIAGSAHHARDDREEPQEVLLAKHNKRCNCTKSGCLKRFCECSHAGILCSENCKCMDCKNFEGRKDRLDLLDGAIKTSGFQSEKKRAEELHFASSAEDTFFRLANLDNNIRVSVPSSSSMFTMLDGHFGTAIAPGASKVTYRSPLAGINKDQDAKEFCSVLAVQSMIAKEREEKRVQDRRESSSRDSGAKTSVGDCSSSDQANKFGQHDSGSDGGARGLNERPTSPGTLALMCDEQDSIFPAAASPNETIGHGCRASSERIYEEQERVILTVFRDWLINLIALGEMKEAQVLSSARTESESQEGPARNMTEVTRTEFVDQRSDGAAESVLPSLTETSHMASAAVPGSYHDPSRDPSHPQNGKKPV